MTLKIMDVSTHAALLKDVYPLPGARIKQWVVELQAEREWVAATCPLVPVKRHLDNTDSACRHDDPTNWLALYEHDCCKTCNRIAELTQDDDDVYTWRAERAKRKPVTEDHTLLSDEVAPNPPYGDNPLFKFLRKP